MHRTSKRLFCFLLSLMLAAPAPYAAAYDENGELFVYGESSVYYEWVKAVEAQTEDPGGVFPRLEDVASSVPLDDGYAQALEYANTVTGDRGDLSLDCASAILIDQKSGAVLYEKAPDEKMPIASVTKVMTLLIIMEEIDSGNLGYDDIITVGENAASMGGSQAYLEVGEKISCRDLLKAVVVSSANDAAVAFAEHISGSVEAFTARMNKKAAELSMTSTTFLNATGLDDTDVNVSSARDVAAMSAALLSHEDITQFTTIWMDSIRGGKFGLVNTNKLVRFFPGATGLKTGYTSRAGFCVSASAKKDDLHLIAVVLKGETSDKRFADAKALLNYGFANYACYVPKVDIPDSVKVCGGKKQSAALTADLSGILCKKSDIPRMTCGVTAAQELVAPVDKNQAAGSVVIKIGDDVVSSRPIVTTEEVEKLTFGDILREIVIRLAG